MKKEIPFLILGIFVFFQMNAQIWDQHSYCNTPPEKSEWLIKFQQNPEAYEKSNDILYVPITFHFVGTDEGEGYVSLQDILDGLCKLNQVFEEAKIHFFLEGTVNYIKNSDWFQGIQYNNMMDAHNVDMYPSMVRDIDDEVLFIFQYDFRPGSSSFGDPAETNYIQFAHIPLSEFGVVETGEVVEPESFHMALFPNPASKQVTLEYELDSSVHVWLSLHDLLGRHMQQISSSNMAKGMHSVQFDIKAFPAGIYLVKLQAAGKVAVLRLVVN